MSPDDKKWYSFLEGIASWFRDTYEEIKDLPEDVLRLIGKIEGGIGGFARSIADGLLFAILRFISTHVDGLVGLATSIAIGIGNALSLVVYPVAKSLALLFRQFFQMLPAAWVPFGEQYIEAATGINIPFQFRDRVPFMEFSNKLAKAFSEGVFRQMLPHLLPSKSDLTSNPYKMAENFLNLNFRFQLDSFALHMLIEMLSFGQMKWAKDLPLNISWAMGLGWLSWLVFSVPFRVAGTLPMEYNLNWIYRMELPTPSQLVDMYLAELIDEEELDTYMGARGYDPYWWERMVLLSAPKLSDSELRTLYQDGAITEEDIEEYLRLKGFRKPERVYKKSLITQDRIRDLRDKIINEAMDLYVEGRFTKAELTNYLSSVGWKKQEIDLAISLCELKKYKTKTLTVSQLIRAYKKNLMTLAEVRVRLLEMGYSPKDIDILIQLGG